MNIWYGTKWLPYSYPMLFTQYWKEYQVNPWYLLSVDVSKAEVVPQVVRRSARQIRPPATERVWNQRTVMKTSCHTEDRSVAALSSTQTSPRARMILTPSSSRSDVLFLINKLTISFLCSASTACILPYREEIWSTSSVSRPWARGWGCWIIRWELLSSSTWRC